MIAFNADNASNPLLPFTNQRLVDSLYELTQTLKHWERIAAIQAESLEEIETIGGQVLHKLLTAAEAAAAACESSGEGTR